jgi:hypothetical protein
MRAAFWRIASVALGAWVATPALIRTMSGTRVASPVATTSSLVPSIARISAGCCAAAGAAASKAAAIIIARIIALAPLLGAAHLRTIRLHRR